MTTTDNHTLPSEKNVASGKLRNLNEMMKSQGRGLWCIRDNNTCLHQPAICHQANIHVTTPAVTPSSTLTGCISCCKPQWHMAPAVGFCLNLCPPTSARPSGQFQWVCVCCPFATLVSTISLSWESHFDWSRLQWR